MLIFCSAAPLLFGICSLVNSFEALGSVRRQIILYYIKVRCGTSLPLALALSMLSRVGAHYLFARVIVIVLVEFDLFRAPYFTTTTTAAAAAAAAAINFSPNSRAAKSALAAEITLAIIVVANTESSLLAEKRLNVRMKLNSIILASFNFRAILCTAIVHCWAESYAHQCWVSSSSSSDCVTTQRSSGQFNYRAQAQQLY